MNDEVIRLVSRNFVPVALLDVEIMGAKDAAGKFFRSVNKQMFINQGVHVASPDGKALASSMPGRSRDGKEVRSDESRPEVWVNEVRAALERGLERFGEVRPREAGAGDALPSDARGVNPDGGVSLGSYTRSMPPGAGPDGLGPPTIDGVTLTAKEWLALAPPRAAAGAQWTVPEAVARKLSAVLSPSCNDSLPRPDEVSAVRLTGKVEAVEDGVAYLRFEGKIAGDHKSVHKYVWSSAARARAGVGAFDVKSGTMLSITLVFEGERRNSKYHAPSDRPERFGAVLEWRRGPADKTD
jgi:hypothetical protein